MTGEQQDWHCIITAGGIDWFIVRCEGPMVHVVDLYYGIIGTVIDTSKVRWDDYCANAVRMDYSREGGRP